MSSIKQLFNKVRCRTRDAAFTLRMGAGFVGDVNRTHPASIAPAQIYATTPPTAYGQPVVMNSGGAGVRPLATGEQAFTEIFGITVRPYPTQQSSVGAGYPGSDSIQGVLGAGGIPPTSGVIDILHSGFIMVQVVGTPTPGAPVYIWTSASTGTHVQGGFEATNPTSSGMALDAGKTYFVGGADANGVAELAFNL